MKVCCWGPRGGIIGLLAFRRIMSVIWSFYCSFFTTHPTSENPFRLGNVIYLCFKYILNLSQTVSCTIWRLRVFFALHDCCGIPKTSPDQCIHLHDADGMPCEKL